MDLRIRVLDDCNAGMRSDAVAEKYSASRAWVRMPDGRWQTTTFVAALRVTGLTAPAVSDGQIFIRTDAFLYAIGQKR